MRAGRIRAIATAASLSMLWACTVVGPDYTPPRQPSMPVDWTGNDLEAQAREIATWWEAFEDPVLSQLIQLGSAQNLSLETAGLRIAAARAALGISDSLRLPQSQQMNGNFSKLYQNETTYNAASLTVDAGWELDIWGRYARGIESAEASLYASIASYRDVLVTLSAEIARNYINLRTAEERLLLSQQNAKIQQRVLEMTQVQFDAGNVSELDVQQSATQLYATQAAEPALSLLRSRSLNALAVLLGTLPERIEPLLAGARESSTISATTRMQEGLSSNDIDYALRSMIPAGDCGKDGIAAALVLRRPDLQVAELQARAQSARIGLAKADLYPRFLLLGSLGLAQTVASGDSFSASRAVTAVAGPGLSWNIFQYDRIENQVRIEDALLQQSLVNYSRQVLEAVREVSDAAAGCVQLQRKLALDKAAVEASIRAFNISANQYNNGLVSYERLLSSVEKMTLREDVYAQTRGDIANQIVALYKALGGGWEGLSARAVLSEDSVEQMRQRTDWGHYLDDDRLRGEDR